MIENSKPNIVILLALIGSLLTGCETLNQPIDYEGSSPLDPPGRRSSSSNVGMDGLGSIYSPGEFINTTAISTPFFVDKPEGNATADQMLPINTSIKFISDKDQYYKVELEDGKIGFVPALMVGMRMDDEDQLPGIIELPDLPDEETPGGLPPLPAPDQAAEPQNLPDLPDPDSL